MSEKLISCSWCRASNRADAKTCASCGAPLSQKSREKPVIFAGALPGGTRLRGGDYELQDVIGQGRFGITYRALNHRLNRVVAIKEWFPSMCARDGLQVLAGHNLSAEEFAQGKATFLEEARGLARFEHPAIVSLFAVWEENRSAYMEMELLHGPTLAQVLARFHHLVAADALHLFAPILDALQQLHEQNWLHRDLNPHNIVLRGAAFEAKDAATCVQNSRAVLIDFGAACQITPDISQEFPVLVTPGYAPLEQYAVRARRGAYSDIYALCATLYHALSGQIPPPAPDRANGASLISLRDLAPAVPEKFCRAIASGLEIEIAQRPQTISDLQKLIPPLPVPQMPVQVLAPPVMRVAPVETAPQVLAAPLKWPQSADGATKNAPLKTLTGKSLWWFALAPLGFALFCGVLRPRVEPNWSVAATRLIDEPASQELPADASSYFYAHNAAFLTPWWTQGKIAQSVFSPLGALAGIDNQGEKGTMRIWDAPSGRVLHSLGTLNRGDWAEMVFSPDGTLLAIRQANSDKPRPAPMQKYSRDDVSERFLGPEQVQLSVVEVSSGKMLWTHNLLSTFMGWASDSKTLTTQATSRIPVGYDAWSGRVMEGAFRLWPGNNTLLSNDGHWGARAAAQTIQVHSTVNGDGWKATISDGASSSRVMFAPDNSWLMAIGTYGEPVLYKEGEDLSKNYAATHSGGRVWFLDLQTGKLINVWSGTVADDSGAGFVPFFSPHGRYVGIRRFDNVLRIWEVRTHRDFAFRWPSSMATNQFASSAIRPQELDLFDWQNSEFSPDEKQILLTGSSRKLWLVDLVARTIRQTQLSLKSSEKLPENRPFSIKASFTEDNQHIVWLNALTGEMGRLSVDDFNQKVPVEIIDGATSRPS